MNTFRFFWHTHKWVGISVAAFLILIAGTGFLLLLKKEFAWIQPPTQQGAEGHFATFISLEEAWKRVEAEGHPDFRSLDDLERIDVRPHKRVYKLRSKHGHSEIQVDAMTGAILSVDTRRSDFIETLHDGSWIGKPVHDYLMPIVALCVLFLALSGCWLWVRPFFTRRKRRRELAARRQPASPR